MHAKNKRLGNTSYFKFYASWSKKQCPHRLRAEYQCNYYLSYCGGKQIIAQTSASEHQQIYIRLSKFNIIQQIIKSIDFDIRCNQQYKNQTKKNWYPFILIINPPKENSIIYVAIHHTVTANQQKRKTISMNNSSWL